MEVHYLYTITSILDPSNLSQTPDISSRLSNQFVLYIVNLRQIYPKPLFYPQIPNDRSEYKIEVIVYIYRISLNNKRAYYYFYKFLDAQTIQGRALIKGANYFLPGP